ncbi:MAG: hypothetical protein L3K06_06730 [Thermoplasmata archaeon]|nr:hypothetical protein [Thermoplasmata archaeon]
MADPAPATGATRIVCPFCGATETDRLEIEGRRFLVFPCMFTPEVDPRIGEGEIAEHLRTEYAGRGATFFQGTCDRLHLYVTKGEGARALGARVDGPP